MNNDCGNIKFTEKIPEREYSEIKLPETFSD